MVFLKKLVNILVPVIVFTVSVACEQKSVSADVLIVNANIWTGNENQAKAESMAILGDSIIAIGTSTSLEGYKSKTTQVLDMKGKFITPGFIDCHVHLLMGGNALLSVELRDADSQDEFVKRIAEHSKSLPSGAWILEGNWDHTLWGGTLPNKEWIDEFTTDNPVALYRLDGHMILANTAALKIAGINKDTPNVEGGEFVKDDKGNLTGILKGHAMTPVLEKIPMPTESEKIKSIKAAQTYLLSNGVTSVHDVDSLGTYTSAKNLKDNGELSVRIYSVDPLNNWYKRTNTDRESDKWLKVGGLKGFVDGSLGSHTAAFREPYTDKPEDSGYFINDEEDLYKWILKADEEGQQVMVHGIGDKAIHSVLNIYERIIEKNGKKDRRLRIEHAQHLAPDDISRFAELGVIVSVQPYHAIDDGRWAEELIGSERIKTTYAFKSLLDAQAKIVFGSDWPVAPATPLDGIYAAVTRRTLNDKNPEGWVPEQKITVEQALTAYTKNAAYASFEDDIKGTLEIGKLADFVVFDEDITKADPITIRDIKILATYVSGKKVFDSNGHDVQL
ncbi:amidohydrolase [Maribacter dokdonensis]|uniref:amidohydrolase n=1 Tax=Maribacter dokdonensis TaxID=320912 RepID=UPI002733543D|nr:amidohydrolase [Maribacter dokdonensis]MDP2524534.1 amidohydrolase [Maribacter dokdonensis]